MSVSVKLYQDSLSKNGFRFIEHLLYKAKTYDAMVQALETELSEVINRMDEICPLKATTIDDMPHGTGISYPTEKFAVKRADNMQVKYLKSRIDEIQRHQKAIKQAMAHMTDTERVLIKLKYDKEKTSKTCWQEMHIEKTRWYEIRQDIIRKVAAYIGVY